jgi:predicted lactoylglutathione lyase
LGEKRTVDREGGVGVMLYLNATYKDFQEQLADAKCTLYCLILLKKNSQLTDNEIDMADALARDEQVQERMRKKE